MGGDSAKFGEGLSAKVKKGESEHEREVLGTDPATKSTGLSPRSASIIGWTLIIVILGTLFFFIGAKFG